MTAIALVLAASNSKSSSSGSSIFFLVLIALVAVAYFAFLRPQQQRAKQQREKGRQVEVGDEVLTVGGIVAKVVAVEDDRIVLVSGADDDGTAPGTSPTRLIVVRQAISRKIEPPRDSGAEPGADAEGAGSASPEEGPRT